MKPTIYGKERETMNKPVRMNYHSPGIDLEEDGFLFQVWGPNETRNDYRAAVTEMTDSDQPFCGYGRAEDIRTVMDIAFDGCTVKTYEIKRILEAALTAEVKQEGTKTI